MTTLEVGVAAAVSAGLANWFAAGRGAIEDVLPACGAESDDTTRDCPDDGHRIFMDPWAEDEPQA